MQPIASDGPVALAAAAELEEVGRLNTAVGQAALSLARRIDAAMTSGQSVAPDVRELRATMAEIRSELPRAADGIDELTTRRRARASA